LQDVPDRFAMAALLQGTGAHGTKLNDGGYGCIDQGFGLLKQRVESGPRFHREAWLAAALNVLAEEGQAKLRIDKLAADLGVTKGSFYQDFTSRDDFVQQLLDFWSRTYTDRVIKGDRRLAGLAPGARSLDDAPHRSGTA
jgi:hypothetical protein